MVRNGRIFFEDLMAKYKRKCENWLTAFGDWTLPRSEAPELYHIFAGFFTMASVLKRRVSIPKSYMGGWTIYPHLYIIFVAPPGRARKSTTMNYTEDLLISIPTVDRAPTTMTKEVLLNRLSDNPDSSSTIISSEFAMFVMKSGIEIYDVLTDVFDGKRDISSGQLSRDFDFAESPCLNLFASTTPKWIADNMPESVIGGGFASRVMFIFEEKQRRYKLYYDDLTNHNFDQLREDLLYDLIHLSTNIQGEFKLEKPARDFAASWYEKAQRSYENHAADRLDGYYQRKPAHLHKLAMLIHLSYSDELILTISDFEKSLAILQLVEKKLPETFKHLGKNPYSTDMDSIRDYIISHSPVTKGQVLAKFKNVATPNVLSELISGLFSMDKINLIEKNGKVICERV